MRGNQSEYQMFQLLEAPGIRTVTGPRLVTGLTRSTDHVILYQTNDRQLLPSAATCL
jgi:hypothetical protein